MSTIVRLLSGVALRNSAALSATAIPISDAVAHVHEAESLYPPGLWSEQWNPHRSRQQVQHHDREVARDAPE
jgi:hypothetical protein